MIKSKYQSVFDLGTKLDLKGREIKEEGGQLKFWATAKNQYQKNLIWDEVKRVGGENPSDIMVDISVEDNSAFAHHTVESGETLGKIAKKYYGDSGKYNAIYEANRDKLKSADLIHPGDELVIPKL